MVKLDYYFRSDIYETDNILKKGLAYDYLKTGREYGFALYLSDKTRVNFLDKNVILNVHFKNLNNILKVTNFDELLSNYLVPNNIGDISSYIISNGKNERLGTKFVQPILTELGYTGLHVTSENLMVLYSTINIKYIKINKEQ